MRCQGAPQGAFSPTARGKASAYCWRRVSALWWPSLRLAPPQRPKPGGLPLAVLRLAALGGAQSATRRRWASPEIPGLATPCPAALRLLASLAWPRPPVRTGLARCRCCAHAHLVEAITPLSSPPNCKITQPFALPGLSRHKAVRCALFLFHGSVHCSLTWVLCRFTATNSARR